MNMESHSTTTDINSDSPSLIAQWFHAIDSPIIDPIALRKAKREKSLTHMTVRSSSTTSPPRSPPKNWVPFSRRDNTALEKAFKSPYASTAVISVNEDHLFEVDISKREISPVYWEGPVYEVRRATWFYAGEGFKWLPCEENMSRQIEKGYQKYKPYVEPIIVTEEVQMDLGEIGPSSFISNNNDGEKEKDMTDTEKQVEEIIQQKEYLLGPYLGQYVIYTDPVYAWLFHDTPGAKIAQTFMTTITNNQNLGGTKLIRGYPEVENEKRKKTEAEALKKKEQGDSSQETMTTETQETTKQPKQHLSTDNGVDLSRKIKDLAPHKKKELDDIQMTQQQAEDYENEESEEEVRRIDQIIFVIHGIGQQMSERMGQNFVHDVNVLRKTMKSTWPIAVSGTGPLNRAHGIQVLPILWRQGILFGNDPTDDKSTLESDMGLPDADDGCPTIDEITLDGAPNIRTLVSDVFLDIPLYLTSRYHSQMIHIVTKEVNRVYKLFIQKNPEFLPNNGQVSILAHSLGSLLALDILSAQPFTGAQLSNVTNAAIITEKKTDTLDFPVKNYFAIGSPQGMIMILRGHKMVSRKTLASTPIDHHTYSEKAAPVSFIYPAADNIYNIFHKSDPVAYRLEPLVVRHYGSKLKPFPIPYIKGGLKSVLDHGYNVTHDFANRAGAMFESIRTGFTGSLFMRGLGFSKPVIEGTPAETELPSRSLSDPAMLASRAEAKSAAKLKALNPNGRLDFYLQEGLLENTYISALSAHMSYWQDVDVAGFLIREVYKNQQLEQEAQKNLNTKTVIV